MKIWYFWSIFLIVGTMGSDVMAGSPVRYALIIGNNYGNAPKGVDLPDLKHAENEIRTLRNKLVSLGHFDESGKRTKVLAGKTRNNILQAAQELAKQRRQDQKLLGGASTLFVFFYTGHGLEGKLLTADQPLTGIDLAKIFKDIQDYHATNVSLGPLVEKTGVKQLAIYHLVPPPRNLFMEQIFKRDLPKNAVLTRDGMIFELPGNSSEIVIRN